MSAENPKALREKRIAEALRPWLTPLGLLKAWLILSAFVFLIAILSSPMNGEIITAKFVRWLLLQAVGALLTAGGGLLAGLLYAWIGGSIIIWQRKHRS